MKNKLNHLLDSVYELEGLVHLALTRDDAPEALLSLIARKGREVAAATAVLDDNPSSIYPEAEPDAAVSITAAPGQRDTETQYDEILDTVLDPVEVPEMFEERAAAEPLGEGVSAAEAFEEEDPATETSEEGDSAAETFEDAATEQDFPPVCNRGPRGKLVFSINDRYRFRRELFNNSDADFNTSLSVVATMDNFDEAEDYFLNELRLDPAAEVVTEFLDVVKKYFKE